MRTIHTIISYYTLNQWLQLIAILIIVAGWIYEPSINPAND